MTRRVSYFYDAEVGNYHYGQGKAYFAEIALSLDLRTGGGLSWAAL